MENSQLKTATQEHDSQSHEKAVVVPKHGNDQSAALVDRVFGGGAGDAPNGRTARLLRSNSLSHPASGSVRAIALKRVQQTHGNRFAQRALAGRPIQRDCSGAGTSEKCRGEDEASALSATGSLEESSRLVQRQTETAATTVAIESDGHDVIPPGSGEPLDEKTRDFTESRFGVDFKDVRVHTDSQAAASAEGLNANAYTSGHDIYFGAGKYAPGTTEGQHLLAHELAHTIQQTHSPGSMSVARSQHGPVQISPPDDPLEKEAERVADSVTSTKNRDAATFTPSGGSPLIQRDSPPAPAQSDPVKAQQDDTLRAANLELPDEDKQTLLTNFPTGFSLTPQQVYLIGAWSGSVGSARVGAFRVVETVPLAAGVESYILRVGKGRAILVSSVEGPSVMLDVGSSVSGSAVAGLNALLGAALVRAPDLIKVSHTDKDHINEVGGALRARGMNNTAVEIGLQQFQNVVGQGDWVRANIQLTAAQSLVQIDVLQATGVHIQRRVIGNMEITEFRQVAPAQTLGTPGQTTSQYKRQKNASSPVTVVQDLVTGQTSVFTADGTGRSFGEMVDIVGEGAFRAVLGGGGRNLTLAEAPHHGGREGPGADARGRIRALRLMFEASDGTVRFFTQTSPSFSSGASASIRYLDQVGVQTERVMDQPTGTPGTSVVRAQGNTLQDITIDNQALQQVLQIARGSETDIMAGYKQLRDVEQLRQRAQSLRETLWSVPERQQITRSLDQLITEMDANRTSLQQSADAYWQALEAATAGGPGVRVGADTTAVNNSAGAIRTAVTGNPLKPFEESINAHEQLVGTELRLVQNALEMFRALSESDIQKVEILKAVQGNLVGEAAAILGAKEVKEQVRAAWAATEAVWTPRVLSKISARLGTTTRAEQRMQVEFRMTLGVNLAFQRLSQQIVETSSMGSHSAVPMRGRVGAGFMAAIELLRIGLEAYGQYAEGKEAEEIETKNRAIRGRNMVQWWISRGVVPEIGLVDDDGKQVASELEQKAIFEILAGKYASQVPEFDRVVVSYVPTEERLQAVAQLNQQVFNLDDWFRLVQDDRYQRQEKGYTPFIKQDDKWNTLLFDFEKHKYTIAFDQAVHDRLETLYSRLRANQEAGFAVERATDPEKATYTVADTGWIRTLRYVYVYRSPGSLVRIDFGHTKPNFVLASAGSRWNAPSGFRPVQAADTTTYERLRQYYWPTDREYLGIYGGGLYYTVNTQGRAFVDADDLKTV